MQSPSPSLVTGEVQGTHLAEESTGLGTQSQSYAAPALQPSSDGGGVAVSVTLRKSHQDVASAFLNHELSADGWARTNSLPTKVSHAEQA